MHEYKNVKKLFFKYLKLSLKFRLQNFKVKKDFFKYNKIEFTTVFVTSNFFHKLFIGFMFLI